MITGDNLEVFSNEVPFERLITVKNGKGTVIFGSSKNELFVYCINGSETSRISWVNAELLHRFTLESKIVEILPHEKKVFVVVEDGGLFSVESADCQDDENDIFEMEDSPEAVICWKVDKVCCIPGSACVLSAATSKLGLCILARINYSLQVYIVKRKIVSSVTLCNETPGTACCCILNISNLSFDFMNLWLPHVERSQEFLLIGLTEGSLHCLPLSLPLKCYCIYRSVHSIVSLSWFQDRLSQRFDALIIVLDSGAVVRLTPVGEEISFPFLPFLNSAVMTMHCIISSGEFETRCLILKDVTNKSKIFPISEVVCACTCSNSKMILVSNKACKIYLLDIDDFDNLNKSIKIKKNSNNLLPQVSDLQQLISSSLHLKKVNKTLKIHDEYLRAKSLVSRASILKEHFGISLKLVQVLEEKHTLRLKVSFSLPGVVFHNEFWKLKVTVSTMDSHSCYTKDLVSNISCEQNLIQLITIPIPFDIFYTFDCKLFAYIECKNVELYLPLGNLEMDASHFLLPPSLKELCYIEQKSSFWINNNCKYSLSVPLETLSTDIEEFLVKLLVDSKALWRNSEWKKMLKGHIVTCILFGVEVEFTVSVNSILVKSHNLKACQALKLAFLKKILDKRAYEYKETFAHYLMGWYQAEDVIKLSSDPLGHINDLYNILKNSNLHL